MLTPLDDFIRIIRDFFNEHFETFPMLSHLHDLMAKAASEYKKDMTFSQATTLPWLKVQELCSLPLVCTSDSPIISIKNCKVWMNPSVTWKSNSKSYNPNAKGLANKLRLLKLAKTQLHQLLLIQCSINEFELQL